MNALPHVRDLMLPLPLDAGMLQVLIVILFLLHLVFVNLMVGGMLLTLGFEIVGLRRPQWDRLARHLADTITVNKSLAVVLGVGPLLAINLLYTLHFYSANALTGSAWIGLVGLVSAAFLLMYLHKYSWDRLADHKGQHLAIGAAAMGLLLFIPTIFLTNVNLMLFPEKWSAVQGFFSAFALPNVIPRYLHFIAASLALTGMFGVAWFTRRGFDLPGSLPGWTRPELRRVFYGVVFIATLVQFIAGPLTFLTLPPGGMAWSVAIVIGIGALCAMICLKWLWEETVQPSPRATRRFILIAGGLGTTVLLMGTGRHLYREHALSRHRDLIRQTTSDFQAELIAAKMRAAAGMSLNSEETAASPGEKVYRGICAGCHVQGRRLVGPPLEEMVKIYKENRDGFISWVKNPGKKRAGFPPMPPIRMPEGKYEAVADYILGEEFLAPPEEEAASPAKATPAKAVPAAP